MASDVTTRVTFKNFQTWIIFNRKNEYARYVTSAPGKFGHIHRNHLRLDDISLYFTSTAVTFLKDYFNMIFSHIYYLTSIFNNYYNL